MASPALSSNFVQPPSAAILTIGDELLTGRTVNTNAAYLGKGLTQLGFCVAAQEVCPDQIDAIKQALRRLERADVLIVTGGLGPTPDDVTRQAIADYFQTPLKFSPQQFRAVSAIYRKLKRKLPNLSRQELYYPAAAKPLVNRFGIALGFWLPRGKNVLVALPGVPTELQKMFTHDVGPFLKRRFKKAKADYSLSVKMTGISEPIVIEKLKKDFFDRPFQFGIYPSEGEVQICIRSPEFKTIQTLKRKIQKRLNGWIYTWDDLSLAQTVGNMLVQKKKTIAVAESCTGGSLAFAWTRHAGASRFFRGGAVVYDALAKQKIGVSLDSINQHGEVSAEVARELALSAAFFWKTNLGVGITGIAGPTGGTKAKPVGLVYIAIAFGKKISIEKVIFWGNRDQIQRKAVAKALELVLRSLRS